jgi:predicted Zn-dependent protease
MEDALKYTEPPAWYHPVRQFLGSALLDSGMASDAGKVFREDLKRYPENGWSLLGLSKALRAQGKESAAGKEEQRFRKAWERADVQLTAPRF